MSKYITNMYQNNTDGPEPIGCIINICMFEGCGLNCKAFCF